MGSIVINDEKMYEYFDNLFYNTDNRTLRFLERKKGLREESGLTNYDVSSMFGSKRLLYKEEDAGKQLCLLEGMQKFLHEYVGIPGLEELLLNNYGTIENSIFFEHDGMGKPAHIREHAKHQMKNAYLGSVLLLDCGYLADMVKQVKEAESAVTKYLLHQAEIVVLGLDKIQTDGELLPEKLMNAENQEKISEKLKQWCYEVFMISSMLHDIGYPLEYYLRSAQRLTDYPPYLKILSPTVKTDFAEIKAYLLESQLFRLTDHEEIKKKYQDNNHGVLSAFSLLMHFYHNGRIYSLNREERCLVEMSAVAIYHHTDKFKNGLRMVYRTDPVSYMVRLCDDLQEWERFEIIINDKHNFLRCRNCGKLLLEKNGIYECQSCGDGYEKVTQISSRKVNYICLCDELRIEKKREKVKIQLLFNLMKQFEIMLEDYTAVIYRAGGLEEVRELIRDQALAPGLDIEYFVSNNPYMLIQQMIKESGKNETDIREFIDSLEDEKRVNMNLFFEDYLQNRKKNFFGAQLEKNRIKYRKKVCEYVKKYYGEVYCLYQYLQGMQK